MKITRKDLARTARMARGAPKTEKARREAAIRFEREQLANIGMALVVVPVSHQAHADLEQLVATGLFGFHIADCAQRLIYEGLRVKAVEGWLPMPAPLVPKKRRAR